MPWRSTGNKIQMVQFLVEGRNFTHQGVLNAKNVKQDENLVRKVNGEERLCKDDI